MTAKENTKIDQYLAGMRHAEQTAAKQLAEQEKTIAGLRDQLLRLFSRIDRLRCTVCRQSFEPYSGEYSRCSGCMAAQHAQAEKGQL